MRRAALLFMLLIGGTTEAGAEGLRLLLGNAAPWIYFDQRCEPAGIVVDVFRAVERASGEGVDFVYLPYSEERAALQDGRLDGDINEINPWYDENLIRIAPVLVLEEVLLLPAQARAAGAERRIGHVATHNSRGEALARIEGRIVEFDGYASLVAAYLRGELDAVAGIKETLLFHLYRQGAPASVVQGLQPLQTVTLWLYVTPAVSPELRRALAAALDAGQLESVIARARSMHLSAHRLRDPQDPAACAPTEAPPPEPATGVPPSQPH